MLHESLLGWELGGAHIKTAQPDRNGCISAVIQWPCPLLQRLDRLEAGIDAVLGTMGDRETRHVVAMTGELTDQFADCSSGVKTLITCHQQLQAKVAECAPAVAVACLAAETVT